MLDVLCGSKNVKKILLFLFVNGKCYGTQLHRLLKTPLTPVQKALLRLEKGGVIHSDYEGKTRIYKFNPAFPLLAELESLLKKAYTLLPPQEKKSFSFVKQGSKDDKNSSLTLSMWERLKQIKLLSFHAHTKSHNEGGWNGRGKGEVIVKGEGNEVLVFHEKGSWQGKQGQDIDFSNVFRWTLDDKAGTISLEHLRRGVNNPVFLFHLAPSGPHTMTSVDSHLCGGDTYFGQIHCDQHALRLNWRVIGHKKNEELDYYYM